MFGNTPWPVVLNLTTNSILRMASWIYSSHQIWFYILGALRPGWTGSWCIDYDPVLRDFAHAPMNHVECVATHPWENVLNVTTHTNLRMESLFCTSHKSGPTAWVLCHLNQQDPSVLIVFQACSGSWPMKHVECLASHQFPVVLNLTTNSILGIDSWFCSSHQIWFNRLGALRIGWTWS